MKAQHVTSPGKKNTKFSVLLQSRYYNLLVEYRRAPIGQNKLYDFVFSFVSECNYGGFMGFKLFQNG